MVINDGLRSQYHRMGFRRAFGQSLLLIFLLLAILSGGCSRPKEAEPPPPTDEIVANYLSAQDRVTTYRSDILIDMDVQVGADQGNHLVSSASLRGTVDTPGQKMEMDITTAASLLNKKSEYEVDLILIKNMVYIKEEGNWINKLLTDDERQTVWQQQAGMLASGGQAKILLNSTFEPVTVQERDGVSCYQLELTPDKQEFIDLLREQLSQGIGSIKDLPADFADMLQDIGVTYWIEQDTYHLVAYEMTAAIKSDVSGQEMSGRIKNTGRFYDYNSAVAIEPPPEAGAAE